MQPKTINGHNPVHSLWVTRDWVTRDSTGILGKIVDTQYWDFEAKRHQKFWKIGSTSTKLYHRETSPIYAVLVMWMFWNWCDFARSVCVDP